MRPILGKFVSYLILLLLTFPCSTGQAYAKPQNEGDREIPGVVIKLRQVLKLPQKQKTEDANLVVLRNLKNALSQIDAGNERNYPRVKETVIGITSNKYFREQLEKRTRNQFLQIKGKLYKLLADYAKGQTKPEDPQFELRGNVEKIGKKVPQKKADKKPKVAPTSGFSEKAQPTPPDASNSSPKKPQRVSGRGTRSKNRVRPGKDECAPQTGTRAYIDVLNEIRTKLVDQDEKIEKEKQLKALDLINDSADQQKSTVFLEYMKFLKIAPNLKNLQKIDQNSYKKKVKRMKCWLHPDKNPGNEERFKSRFQKLGHLDELFTEFMADQGNWSTQSQ